MESSVEKDDLISNFCSITGVEASRGQFYLESANWNLQLAIQSFFEHSDDISGNQNSNEGQAVAQNIREMITDEPIIDPNESDDEMSSPEESSSHKTHKKEVKKEPNRYASNFATLDSLRQQQDSGASSEEEGQAFYTGGSERSGQQVLGPSKKKNADELVSSMFKSAKEHGAEVVDQTEEEKRKKRINAFVGTGFRLGSATEDSIPVNPTSSTPRRGNIEMVLKLWKNGFSIDDGQVRAYEDPENQEFLASIHKGEIPRELIRKAEGREVHLNMEDHRNEEFVQEKKRVEAFSGEGHRLGNPTADLISSAVPQSSGTSDPKKCEEEAQKSLDVNQTEPLTNIQIRLTDGTRLVLKANLTHTVADIRQFICRARPAYSATPFILMTTFPNKELSDETLTIKDANLANASIVQRIK